MYFIGIDASSSYSKLVACSENGKILGHHMGNTIDFFKTDKDTCSENLTRLLKEFLKFTGIKVEEVKNIGIGVNVSSSDYRSGFTLLKKAETFYKKTILEASFDSNVVVSTDLNLMLFNETNGESGILVYAGYDTKAYGFGKNKKPIVCGGWGNFLGDDGSLVSIAKDAVRHALMAHENRSSQTMLTEKILSHYNIANIIDVIPIIESDKFNLKTFSEIYLYVKQCAEEGDEISKSIQVKAAQEIFNMSKALIDEIGDFEGKIILYGRVFSIDNSIKDNFIKFLKQEYNKIELVVSKDKIETAAMNFCKLF